MENIDTLIDMFREQKRSRSYSPTRNYSRSRSYSPSNVQIENSNDKLFNYDDYEQRSRVNKGYCSSNYKKPKFESSKFQSVKNNQTVFVHNIAFTIPEEELKYFFTSYIPQMQRFKLVDHKNDEGRVIKRFAFITVSNQKDFDTLLSLDQFEVDGRKLKIRKADDKSR
jgi:hypothetical protein